VRHVLRIADLSAHPLRKRLMMRQQRGVISALRKTPGLCIRANVEQAHRDGLQPRRRGRSDHLGGRDRITGEQQVSPASLQFDSSAHSHLYRLLAPYPHHRFRRRDQIQQLDALNRRG
jgi:hypothetical protein